ncbi:hypothetical protein [Brevibacillus fulvus]|uniref:Uncharacterized protein n=1 Tax=Brevibacillus fulvus TaxID=1125967 RepID=A0A938XWH0_9BACL|nr:hypothetical protein [Brevibacillus fulvus]MBM7589389.1 hypothetical protein [Brevibacillus fulvus]
MNVIGIVQNDLNEFTVLFEPNGSQANNQDNSSSDNGGQNQNSGGASSFLNLLGLDSSAGNSQQGQQNQQSQQQQQSQPQEMTVRIKGIPEGQKATFLQMYQILEDAKEEKDLESKLTIVNRGNPELVSQGGSN